MVWTLEYLNDLEADFRAFYHEEAMMELPSATFFRLAERTFAFPGVLQARLRKEAQDAPGGARPATASTSAPTHPAGQRWNLRERGGEAVAVASDQPSYLHEKMKARTP